MARKTVGETRTHVAQLLKQADAGEKARLKAQAASLDALIKLDEQIARLQADRQNLIAIAQEAHTLQFQDDVLILLERTKNTRACTQIARRLSIQIAQGRISSERQEPTAWEIGQAEQDLWASAWTHVEPWADQVTPAVLEAAAQGLLKLTDTGTTGGTSSTGGTTTQHASPQIDLDPVTHTRIKRFAAIKRKNGTAPEEETTL